MRIAINGAGIAGTTLAYFLRRSEHDVLLVERAPRLRSGGYAIDFWGVGYDIAEKMGLLPRIRELGYRIKEMRYVDRHGHRSGGFPVDAFRRMAHGRFTELQRTDLATMIYDALDGGVETIFGDSVATIENAGDHVHIGFEHAAPRDVDLIIGADGLHSRVRELAFGPEAEFAIPLGYHVAAFQIEGYRPREDLVAVSHGAPGRLISRLSLRDDRTLFLFVFRDELMDGHTPANERERRSMLTRIFADVGWEAPRILAAMDSASDVYFDGVSQVRMDRWTLDRTALIGDAAACVSLLAGEGTGLAMAEAYVLAGELHDARGDHDTAFARYQQRMMPFLESKQKAAVKFASSFAPKSAIGVAFRDNVTRLLQIPLIAHLLLGHTLRDDIVLPDYRFSGG
jgi:2-polyprenyl-6-methoxyphenol hydroxylase-like FAD-dependent oxidoreductase